MPLRSISASRPPTMSVILSAALATTSGTLPAACDATAVLWLPGSSRLKCSSSVTTRILSPRHDWRPVMPWYDIRIPALSGGVDETGFARSGMRHACDDHRHYRTGAGPVSIPPPPTDRAGDPRRPGRYCRAPDRAVVVSGAGTTGRPAQQARCQWDVGHA